MRLDKLLSNMGVGSRKEVKALLKKKQVTVNGIVSKDSGEKIDPNKDEIAVNGEIIRYQQYIYLMMNKAPGYISATTDKREKTVIDLLGEDVQHFKPFPVGRLDKDTEGLLLLTNDGELAHELVSPKKDIGKTYFARINGKVTVDDTAVFREGVVLEDGYEAKPGELTILQSDAISEIELTITEGKFHQVKRMFEAVGKRVIYLKRLRMGELQLDPDLKLGAYRPLTESELAYCKSLKK
ncbi:pseudouridine synthase [Oceanobacillus profundus]|uniref:Pseudouridine synthase n=1 Tax=Oceanobacillus profundus TaxID=372463 RepID=A0A417YAU7_9BACI|nr:pseudouridine synthase [Oceanobacillus profundus]MBR3120061.1 rRNA pseudouridine synthase [Oceanobacillus sp.]MCM3398266.1 rRNA pseudouridine synthase [Oceanobacillus profundus]PAE30843.1 16S rRNA pseudouridine(516) synthase [Paenibacillus sp. 7884-2]RHW29637.1 rRNA pseudouridine synthase [Oceanobacillus profundus]